MPRARSALLAVIAFVACRPSHDAASDPSREMVSVAPPFDASFLIEDAGVDAAHPVETDVLGIVEYVADGTLLAIGQKLMLARSKTGEVARYRLPEGATVDVDAALRGAVARTETSVTLLSTPRLTVLYDGPGVTLSGSASVVVVERDRALAFQHGDTLGRIVLPGDVPLDSARTLRIVAHDTRADVTFENDTDGGGAVDTGVLYDLATGARVGRGVPVNSLYALSSAGAMLDTVGFLVEGKVVSRVDLEKGTVLRKAPVVCSGDQLVGNPTPSPSGDLLLVTCGSDGLVLDGATLAMRRRIPSILPGCDNGPYLGGEILPDGHTLRLDGCGGEARLDLQAGKYICADDGGLLGAPYDMGLGLPHGQVAPRVPAGREHVPRCAKGDATTSRLGASGRYRLDQSDHSAVVYDGGSVDLGENVGYPVIAPDESAIAYAIGEKVFVRSLPDGKVLAELTLAAP